MKETLYMLLHQFPLFFTIGFLGTLMLEIYVSGLTFDQMKKAIGYDELFISSAIIPISAYVVVLFFLFTWKITFPLLGVLLLLDWIRS